MPRSLAQQKITWRLYERIVALNDSNMIDADIAKQCGCSLPTVSRARRDAGLKKIPPYKGFPSKLTPQVKDWMTKNYLKLNDTKMAKKIGVTEGTITNWRTTLGLHYEHSGKWTRYPHPKGMKGKKHKPEIAEASRRRMLAWQSDPNSKFNSKEFRQQIGDRMSKLARSKPQKNVYSSAKRGYRKDLGKIFFRSRWEANYARYLNFLKDKGEIYKWEFEADVFWFEKIKRGVRSYCPDFKIWDVEASEPRYVEIKGWMDPKSKTKLKRMAKYYPKVRLELVGEKEYKSIERELSAMIPEWELKNAA